MFLGMLNLVSLIVYYRNNESVDVSLCPYLIHNGDSYTIIIKI